MAPERTREYNSGKRWATLLCAAAAASMPSIAYAQFQFEIPSGLFEQAQPRRRGSNVRVPRDIHENFMWMKGTEWMWNNWAEIRFEPDGTFTAPTDSCAQRQCKWSADDKQVYIRWGRDGVHWVKPSKKEPVQGNKLSGKREDGERCSATFVRKELSDEDLDLYEVLGVDEDSDSRDIKKAFRKLAILYHPDKCSGTVKVQVEGEMKDVDCVTMMNRVNTAYEVLGDEGKRILYDAGGMEMVKQGDENNQQGGMDPFAAFFGGGRRNSNKGQDAHMEFSVSLEDIYNGNEVKASFDRRVVCRGCKGDKGANKPKCQSCGRCPDEVRMVQRQMGPGMIVQQEERVPSQDKCKVENTEIKVTVERGVAEGGELRFARMAEQSPGQVPGDVVLTLRQKRHQVFTREGNDLHITMVITLKEALLGFSKTITHLDGHEVEISKTSVTRPFSVKKISGEGMPIHNFPSDFGDLHVKFEIKMPAAITNDQREAIERLF